MEPPLGSPSRRRVPWQGLLLTVSLLTFWNPPAAAQLSVESVPLNAVEGKHVLLLAHNVPQDTTGYSWYKGDTVGSSYRIVSYVIDIQESITGPAYSGRETIYPNGSLLFQNVTLKDTGYYMLQIIRKNFDNKEVTGQLRVYSELPKPSITSNSSSPVEDEDSVALTCEPETQNTTYLWWKDGQRLQDSDRLVMSLDNRTLILIFITRNDTGSYQCGNWNPVSGSRSDPVTLNVLYGPDVPTISPPDSYYPLGANLHLSCHAASNPPAQYSWLINGSLQIPTQELFVPSVTMSHSGSYACVAHNSATGRNSTTVKNITVLEPQPVAQPSIHASSSTVTEDKDSVVLTCLTNDTGISIRWIFNNQSLQVTERMQLSQDNISLSINPVERGHAGGYQCEVSNPVSHCRSDIFRLTVELDPSGTSHMPAVSCWILPGASRSLLCQGSLCTHSWHPPWGSTQGNLLSVICTAELPKPSITSNSSSPVEDEDSVALTCEPETQDTTYLWWKDGQRLQDNDRLVMSLDNRTLILLNITRNDTGSYQCENRNPVSGSRSDPVNLNVLYGPDVPTISPPDSYYPPGANLHLTCHAASNPPAQYSWLINGSLQPPTQELFVPNVTVNNSGSYACVAHNFATGRNRTTVKNITVSGK
uniref:Ig-like domain-containing protein n=2 Tax=Microcebus murinus TaxID=30608 RepID=A0A8C5V2R8_MICMU